MIDDPMKMMRGIIMLAPEVNMKVALLNLIDYVDDKINGDDEDEIQFRVEDLLEVVIQSLVKLHYDIEEVEYDDDFYENKYETNNPITSEEVEKFKQMLGIIPNNEQKEEDDE